MNTQDPKSFRFFKGPPRFISKLESMRRALIKASPAIGNHVGANIRQTDDGWSIVVDPPKNKYSPGILIYRGSGSGFFLPYKEIFVGEESRYDHSSDDNWSLEFKVENGRIADLNTNPPFGTSAMDDGEGTEGTERFDGDASAVDESDEPDPIPQTYYRIPVIRTVEIPDGEGVAERKIHFDIGGIYRENIKCAGQRGRIVELLRIG